MSLLLRFMFISLNYIHGNPIIDQGFCWKTYDHMGVFKNRGTPKSSILIGFSIINHPSWGTPIFGNTHIGFEWYIYLNLAET